MKITLDFLASRGACIETREKFLDLFGEECEFNEENIVKYIKYERYAYMDFRWLASNLLDMNSFKNFMRFYFNSANKNDADEFSHKVGMKLKELLDE